MSQHDSAYILVKDETEINIVIYIMGKVRFSLPLALCGGRVHNSGQGHHTSPLFVKVAW